MKMADWALLPDADDVMASVETVTASLESRDAFDDEMRKRAGSLTYSCARTLAHMCDAVLWYAGNLAARSPSNFETPLLSPRKPLEYMLSCLRSSGALLAAAVRDAPADVRGHHSWGRPDPSGFAAMGCDEMLVHGWDIAQGLGLPFTPPSSTAERTLRRLFPWAPTADEADPWQALLWANGRVPLGERQPEKRWIWHNEPLADWNGEVRRRSPRPKPA
jgi:hypothetical protein